MSRDARPLDEQARGIVLAIFAVFAIGTFASTTLDYNIYSEMLKMSESEIELLYTFFGLLAAYTLYDFWTGVRD